MESAVIASDIRDGCMACEDKLVNEKRLTGQEESGDERVPCAKLGIDGFHYLKTHISQIAEDTTAVWQPSNFNTLAGL